MKQGAIPSGGLLQKWIAEVVYRAPNVRSFLTTRCCKLPTLTHVDAEFLRALLPTPTVERETTVAHLYSFGSVQWTRERSQLFAAQRV